MRTTINGLKRKLEADSDAHTGPGGGERRMRILALFEPRSNTMKLGSMKALLPWALEEADLAFCHAGQLGWDPAESMAPLGSRAVVCASVEQLVARVVAQARPGDHLLCMSNGGFGGVHDKLLAALAAARPAAGPPG
jgi:UDP-N-acetylmuramate: L-alanyl-gamma-D-glutamyl-meso-diaminopimelate ligase